MVRRSALILGAGTLGPHGLPGSPARGRAPKQREGWRAPGLPLALGTGGTVST